MNRSKLDALARFFVYAVLLYTCVEGLVVNIGYPSVLPHVYKDLAIAAAYLLVYLPQPGRLVPPTLRNVLIPLCVFAIATLSYLVLPGIGMFVALIGLKQKLFYIPLIGVGYFFVRSTRDLIPLLAVLVFSAIPVAMFGIYLHFAGPGFLKQIGANYSLVILTAPGRGGTETYWRVPGTFTSPGQYGAYLLFIGVMTASFLLSKLGNVTCRITAAFALVLITLAMFGTGSRAPFLLLSVCVAGIIIVSRSIPRITVAATTVAVALTFGLSYLGTGVKGRFASIVDYEHIDRFQRTYFAQLFLPMLLENPLGSGLGVATVGARHFAPADSIRLVESYLGILAAELGAPGLAAMLWVAIAIVLAIVRKWRWMGRSPTAMIWYGFASYVLVTIAILPISTSIDHTPTNVYFWFSIGVVFKLLQIERGRRRRIGQTHCITLRGPKPAAPVCQSDVTA